MSVLQSRSDRQDRLKDSSSCGTKDISPAIKSWISMSTGLMHGSTGPARSLGRTIGVSWRAARRTTRARRGRDRGTSRVHLWVARCFSVTICFGRYLRRRERVVRKRVISWITPRNAELGEELPARAAREESEEESTFNITHFM